MKDFRTLTQSQRGQVEEKILDEIDKTDTIEVNGEKHNTQSFILGAIKIGYYCAGCLRSPYTCLCSHDDKN